MRRWASWMAVVAAAWAGAAGAQEADGDDLVGEAISTRAYACRFEDEVMLIPLRQVGAGFEALGGFGGSTVTREEERIALTHGADFVQIDGANSVFVASGGIVLGICSDVSVQLFELVALAVGGEAGPGVGAMRESLMTQLAEARAEVEATRVEARREVEAARAEAEAPRTACRDELRFAAPIVQALRAGGVSRPTMTQYAERLESIVERCGGG